MVLYLLQVAAYTGAFYLIYRLLLRNLPWHGWTRLFLILAMVLPLVLPMLQLGSVGAALPEPVVLPLPELIVGTGTANGEGAGVHWGWWLYGGIAGVLLLRWGYTYGKALRYFYGQPYTRFQGYRIIRNAGDGPGSFGRVIFFPAGDIDPVMLRHELAHIAYGHRYDLLLAGLLQCLFWPNLFLRLISSELRLVHEFQADAVAAAACPEDVADYARRLLQHVFGVPAFPLAHSFFHQPIKRRIMMLQTSGTTAGRIGRAIAALSLTFLFAATTLWAQSGRQPVPPSDAAVAAPQQGEVLHYVEQMPEFNGDAVAYLSKAIKYPEEAKNANQQGRVIVKFVVNQQGKVEQPTIAKSSGFPALDREAMRVVSAMPAWQPGKKDGKPVSVYYFLPIKFAL